jgi:hypothetical protein
MTGNLFPFDPFRLSHLLAMEKTVMNTFIVLSVLAAGALMSTQAVAQGPRTNLNLEPTCQGTGGGMDPRCIGDVTPGSDRSTYRTRSGQRFDSRVRHSSRYHARHKSYRINCTRHSNRNNPRCM